MARAFVTLGKMGAPPPNPRAWLFRVAHNVWIDPLRRRVRLLARETAESLPTTTTQYGPEDAHQDGEAVRAITTLEPEGDRVARVANDVFSPDFLAEVCGELSAASSA